MQVANTVKGDTEVLARLEYALVRRCQINRRHQNTNCDLLKIPGLLPN